TSESPTIRGIGPRGCLPFGRCSPTRTEETFPMGTDDLARELEAIDARLKVLADSAHPDEQAEFDRLVAKRTDVSDKLRRHEELRRSADIPGRQELPYGTGPTVLKRGP